MRIMGLDYGTKTVGIAISDPLFITAQSLEIVRRERADKLRQTLARIKELCDEYEIGEIVLGYPKLLNNDVSDTANKALAFKEMLEKRTGLFVTMWDERLSSVESNKILMESKVRREDRYKYVDMVAAQIILQSYLDYRHDRKDLEE